MIEVRLFATLRESSRSGLARFELPATSGLTVGRVLADEGVAEETVHIVMINGKKATFRTELRDGDRLGLFPPVGGG